jgi:hypothetical protein
MAINDQHNTGTFFYCPSRCTNEALKYCVSVCSKRKFKKILGYAAVTSDGTSSSLCIHWNSVRASFPSRSVSSTSLELALLDCSGGDQIKCRPSHRVQINRPLPATGPPGRPGAHNSVRA